MKKIYLQLVMGSWLALLSLGLVSRPVVWAQSIPDIQWTQPGSALAVTTDGNIIGTKYLNQGNNPGFPSVQGDGVVKYSLQGNQLWGTGLLKGGYYLGGKIPGYDFEALGRLLLAGTADGGVAVMGKTSLRGANVVTKINANGGPRVWQEGDLIGYSGESIFEDIVGTPDGGFVLLITNVRTDAPTTVALRKYDASGNFAWSKPVAYPNANPASPDLSLTKAEAVINTPDGGYLIVGYYNTTGILISDANKSLVGNTGWVAKLDGNGTVMWQKLLNGLPLSIDFNGPLPSTVLEMLPVTDVTLSANGSGYALVGFGLPPSNAQIQPSPSTALLELNLDGSFKRARLIDPTPTEAFITTYTGTNNTKYYAIGHTSTQNGLDPEILLVSTTNLPANDPALFNVAARRTFDNADNVSLQDLNKAGDGSLVFLGSNGQVVKLKVETSSGPLVLTAPTYNCQTGAITFNVSGGNGSTITYTAPGITRASLTDNFGVVEPGLRNDPKVIPITAMQSGVSVTYNFDLKAACSGTSTPQPPVLNRPIPDLNLTVGQSTVFPLGTYFTDPTTNVPNYRSNWFFRVNGLPPGLDLFIETVEIMFTPAAAIVGSPTTTGVYTVTVTSGTAAFSSTPITTTFRIIVSPANPPVGSPLVLTAPTYNCQTGAITFNVSGGNGSTITYTAPGITRASLTDNFGVVEPGLRNDPKVIPITAMQSGVSVTYNFDLKAACSSTPTLQPPVVRPIPDLSYTVGESVYFVLGGYFSDPNGNIPNYIPYWSISANGLPQSLSLFLKSSELMYTPAAVILGTATATGVYTVTATARTTGGSVTTTFKITISSPPTGDPLALIAPDYNCSTGAITFKTKGGDGSLIEYQAPGITGWTSNPNQFVDKDSRTANDVQPFTLMARQSGHVVTYIWDLKAACGRARMASEEPGTGLQVRILGNPIVGQTADLEISGVRGQTVLLNLIDGQGRTLHQQTIRQADAVEQVRIPIGRSNGLLLLQVHTAGEHQTLKLLKL